MLPLFTGRKANLFVVLYTESKEKCTYSSVHIGPSNGCLGWQRSLSCQRQTLPALFAPGPIALWLWVVAWICHSPPTWQWCSWLPGLVSASHSYRTGEVGTLLQDLPSHIHSQGLSPMQQDGSCHSFKQESGKNLCVVMIWTLLSPSRQEILFLKGRICLHRMLFRREAKARRVTQMFLNHQTDRNREKQLRAVLRVLKLLKAWKVWNSKYIELRPRGHIPSCRPLITEKGLPAVLS